MNEGDKKVVLNYIKTQKLLASPIDGLKALNLLMFFPSQQSTQMNGGRSLDVNYNTCPDVNYKFMCST